MRTTKHYTLVLEPETAKRVAQLTEYFGGSIGGFASGFVTDVSRLSAQQVVAVREFVRTMNAGSPVTPETKKSA